MTVAENRIERKAVFIRALAKYLTCNQAAKSIKLQMGLPDGVEWRDIRQTTPLFGYPTEKAAVKILTEFLG